MDTLATLYKDHIATLQQRAQQVLARFQLDAMLIHSGELLTVFRMTITILSRLIRSSKHGCR